MESSVIFDFETLSQNPFDGVVLSFAMLNFNKRRFDGADPPYTYQELVSKAKFIKFDVEEQVSSFGRKIQKDTLEWWSNQGKEAQKVLKPSKMRDKSISELYSFFKENCFQGEITEVYTRRNTFDPVFMTSLMQATGNPEPYDWWLVRDTISYIEGLSYGAGIKNDFIPEGLEDKFVKHDPRHDIAIDVMRMQVLYQALGPLSTV